MRGSLGWSRSRSWRPTEATNATNKTCCVDIFRFRRDHFRASWFAKHKRLSLQIGIGNMFSRNLLNDWIDDELDFRSQTCSHPPKILRRPISQTFFCSNCPNKLYRFEKNRKRYSSLGKSRLKLEIFKPELEQKFFSRRYYNHSQICSWMRHRSKLGFVSYMTGKDHNMNVLEIS